MFFDHRACVLVLAYPSKFRVPKVIDLRFILHRFVATTQARRSARSTWLKKTEVAA